MKMLHLGFLGFICYCFLGQKLFSPVAADITITSIGTATIWMDQCTSTVNVVSPPIQLQQGTAYYEESSGTGVGSCGIPIDTIQGTYGGWVVGLSTAFMSTAGNPNNNPLCAPSQCIAVTAIGGSGAAVVVKISDTFGGAPNPNDLNLSAKAFAVLAPLTQGYIAVNWRFVDCTTNPVGPVAG